MRKRSGIEENVFVNTSLKDGYYAHTQVEQFAIIVEVLLDIRDLLSKHS